MGRRAKPEAAAAADQAPGCGNKRSRSRLAGPGSRAVSALDHAALHWPQMNKVRVSYRGAFAYIGGVLPGGEQIPLCRLRYGGSAHSFGFAIYSAASGGRQDAILRTGLPAGTPQAALDTACTVHLAGLGHEPAS
jgi:hypothetical protein